MAIVLASNISLSGDKTADEAIPFDVTLAVADTSEVLFTVPGGKFLRSLSVANEGNGAAHVSLTATVAATTADIELGKRDSFSENDLDMAEGTYEFIGAVGETPRVRGLAMVGPAA
jgi:hypothetical protein